MFGFNDSQNIMTSNFVKYKYHFYFIYTIFSMLEMRHSKLIMCSLRIDKKEHRFVINKIILYLGD